MALSQSPTDLLEKDVLGYVPPPDEAKMLWLAQGLKQPIEASVYKKAPPKAGLDTGQNFYMINAGRLRLALREDGMVAYISEVADGVNDEEILETLKICNLVDTDIPPGGHIHGLLSRGWVQVCAGQVDQESISTKYNYPGEPTKALPIDTLKLMSQEIEGLWAKPDMGTAYPGLHCGLTALPGDVLATIQTKLAPVGGYDIFGRHLLSKLSDLSQPKLGENVVLDGNQFRASCYGYVVLFENVLSIKPPFWIDQEAIHLYWCLLDHRPRPVTEHDVQAFLDKNHIVEGIQQKIIETLLTEIPEGKHTLGAHLVAEAEAPVHGKDGYLELLVDTQKRIGTLHNDGSVDFGAVDFKPEAQPNVEIARLHPASVGKPGRTIRGEIAKPHQGIAMRLNQDESIRVEEKEGILHYFATKAGVVKHTRTEILILDLLVIDGDINYKTGNLNFQGEIFIKGSVGPSFSVIANGNITVGGNVEIGAKIMSKGNILVGKGISGRKTRVIALGHIQAQFVSDALLQCGHNIYLGNYTSGAQLRAGARIKIDSATGQKGGCAMGGQMWASHSIDVYIAGASNQMATELNVGVNPEQAEKLGDIDTHLQEAHKLVIRYLKRFDLDYVNVQQIQNILAASSGPRKKVLILSAKQLGEAVQAQQRLTKAREEIRAKVDRLQYHSVIIVRDRVMPGVVIRVGDYTQKALDVIRGPRYKIQNDRLISR
ncbi:MAG: hypothetical protein ACI8V2_000984 [Candidatus Latescibacterota bacterium]|jgi:uncharacterized protein (DUF342 family)